MIGKDTRMTKIKPDLFNTSAELKSLQELENLLVALNIGVITIDEGIEYFERKNKARDEELDIKRDVEQMKRIEKLNM